MSPDGAADRRSPGNPLTSYPRHATLGTDGSSLGDAPFSPMGRKSHLPPPPVTSKNPRPVALLSHSTSAQHQGAPHSSSPRFPSQPSTRLGEAQTRLLTAKRSRGLGTDFLALFSRLRQAPQRIPAEAKGIAAVNNAATSAIKCQIEVTGAVLVSTRWSRAVGAGWALSRS